MDIARRGVVAAAVLAASVGCTPTRADPNAGASASSSSDPVAAASASASSDGEISSMPSPASSVPAANLPLEARESARRTLTRLEEDRLVASRAALVGAHFDGGVPLPLELQTVALPGERRAQLVYRSTPPLSPLLFVTGPASEGGPVLWTKERPLAGTRQIVTEMVLAPGPSGEVALLWCDIPTQIVGLRKWAADGVVLADFEVLEVDLCEALAALYWPGHGWVAVASQHGAARAQMLDERGARAWGSKAMELPWSARPSAPAAIVVDADDSVMVFQIGDRPMAGSISPDRVLAMRYDAHGAARWDLPIDLGPAPSGRPGARLTVAQSEPGKVRVTVGAGGSRTAVVTVTSAGGLVSR